MMKSYDWSVKVNHNPNWFYVPDYPYWILIISGLAYRILIIGGLGSCKTEINDQILTKFNHAKDAFESKFNCLSMKTKLKNRKAFIVYPQTINEIYTNLEDYNPSRKRRVLIIFNDMIADMKANKTLTPIVTELFWRGRKFNISLVFM